MNIGKCNKCGKTVYQQEGLTAGPPGKTQAFHKGCFKCVTCGWQLTLTNYKAWEGKAYCANHYPVTGFGDHTAKHVSGQQDAVSRADQSALNAPKIDTHKSNVVVDYQDHKPAVGLDAVELKHAREAPKGDVQKSNVLGPQGHTPAVGLDSIELKNALDAPKIEQNNQTIR
ncbi:LIM-type zinc finger-containing protein [Planoprotostelium fungivorum]|uniref:LIM-type zinc finger-containing protein n=1 Tax=Planoprotostelium fungivorum TaxID=1890364 RepID=A0A2P6MQZ4_9EUKA|nr:LIM-type zinc finger-containing protein [Planoprotostelium fungivorum]